MIEEMDEKKIKDNHDNKRWDYAKTNGLAFGFCNSCLVGEANHNSGKYTHTCAECCRFCQIPAFEGLSKGGETFQAFKLDLFTHMLEAHPQLMIK